MLSRGDKLQAAILKLRRRHAIEGYYDPAFDTLFQDDHGKTLTLPAPMAADVAETIGNEASCTRVPASASGTDDEHSEGPTSPSGRDSEGVSLESPRLRAPDILHHFLMGQVESCLSAVNAQAAEGRVICLSWLSSNKHIFHSFWPLTVDLPMILQALSLGTQASATPTGWTKRRETGKMILA